MKIIHYDVDRLPSKIHSADEINRYVVLPNFISESLKSMRDKTRNEIRLVLLAKLQKIEGNLFYLVQYFRKVGEGETSVFADPQEIDILEKLIQEEDLQSIDSHTHPANLGDHFSENFSKGDINSIERAISRSSGYIHLLLTPKEAIIASSDKHPTGLLAIPDDETVKNRFLELQEKRRLIAENFNSN